MIYIGEVSKYYKFTIGVYDVLLDRISGKMYFVIYSSDTLIRENYAYIPETQRYYYITNKESIRTGIWRLHMKVDPLMSFKRDILALSVVVSKQSAITNGDEYIDDGSLVTDNQLFKTVYKFADGFNDNAQYILITAG